MQLAMIQALAIGWMVTCLVKCISGSPPRPYWNLQQGLEVVPNYPEISNRFGLQIDYENQYQRSSNSPYEKIEQQNLQPEYNDYSNKYYNRYENDEESYYQRILRVTENPLMEYKNYQSYPASVHDSQTYYQDYLPLDAENESFNAEEYHSKEIEAPNVENEIKEDVKNSTDDKNVTEFMTKLLIKEAKNLDHLNALNSLEDEMIAEATVPDEIKREIRQARAQQPAFLWTLAKLAFDQVNDTKSAVNQIGTILNSNFAPEEPPTLSPPTTTTTSATTTIETANLDSNVTTTTTTTTEAPFRLTRTNLQGIIRRNLKGLVRLFNIEWRDALNQSKVSTREFQRDLGNQIRPYLEDNPNVTFN